MLKNSTGAVISYGPTFPSADTTFDGALFYKSSGSDQGLYIFGFAQDADPFTPGDQSIKAWNSITTAAGTFVAKAGDVMSGALGVTGGGATNDPYGRITVTLPSDSNSYGHYGLVRQGSSAWTIGIDTSNRLFLGSGSGALSNVASRWFVFGQDGSFLINGATVWHSANDGTGSGLDADLLDGQSSAFYTNATNINAGTLAEARLPFQPVQQGGILGMGSNKIYIGWSNSGNNLQLQVDSSNMGALWPIDINGNAASAGFAANSAAIGGVLAANVLTTSNYNTYTPTLTGTGASGSWNISSAQLGGIAAASYARLDTDQTFTGVKSGVTQASTDNSTKLATTAYVKSQYDAATYLKAANGFFAMPNGFIMQWGAIAVGVDATAPITFPTAFPTACVHISGNGDLNNISGGGASQTAATFQSVTTTGAVIANDTSAQNYRWFAIGY